MIRTTHNLVASEALRLGDIVTEAPALIVTSPPYPMIAMWDESFAHESDEVRLALDAEDGLAAFAAMHDGLDRVWARCFDVLMDGGLICVNIGDAVRSFSGEFRLYANVARVTLALERAGFVLLPQIIWRKPANSPTKFMGSGMLPGGAYVTLEHEAIVIGRKGGLRRPTDSSQRALRRRSAIFWEERNEWYSDLWRLTGVRQDLPAPAGGSPQRDRSAAFPLELAFRLIAMHSWLGDTVIDPFAGTGTTTAAAMSLARSSVSLDRNAGMLEDAAFRFCQANSLEALRSRTVARLESHREFVGKREKPPAHSNRHHGTPVVTAQETDIEIPLLARVTRESASLVCDYDWKW